MRRKRLLAAVSLAVVAASLAAFTLWRRTHTPPGSPPQVEADAPLMEISVAGTVRVREVALVPVPIEGTIETFSADVGEEVYEGQILAHIRNTGLETERDLAGAELERAQERLNRMESTLIQARLEASRASADASRARAELERAERVWSRQQMLYREGATPRLAWEKAQREYEAASVEYETLNAVARQAEERASALVKEIDTAKRTLDGKKQEFEAVTEHYAASDVRSPVTGMVVVRRGNVDDKVTREMEDLFEIAADLTNLDVEVEPDPKALGRIQEGQPVLIYLTEFGLDAITGKIRAIRDGKVLIEFTNPGPYVKPGDTVQVRIPLVE